MEPKHLARNNVVLLICLLLFILFFPFSSSQRILTRVILFTAIVFFGSFSLDFTVKKRRILIASGVVTILATWLNYFTPGVALGFLAFLCFFCFNVFITVFMVRHVAKSKQVTGTIIINSINGYLLTGVLGAVLLAMTEIVQKFIFHQDGATIQVPGNLAANFHDLLYFSFVTLTTLGYGDITPVSTFAKSLTVIIAVAGQLYLTILIALLVGKYVSRS